MPRIPQLHVTKTKNGTYQYCFSKASINGKRVRCYGTYPTEKQAWVEGRKAFAMYYDTGTGLTKNISYADFSKEWIENDCVGYLSDGTVGSYRKRLKNLINPHIGDKYLTSILPLDLNALLLDLYNQGYSRNTLTMVKAILTKSFRFAVENRYITIDPSANLKLPNGRKKPKTATKKSDHHFLSDSVMNRVFKALQHNPTYYLVVKVGYLCGLRHGEIFGLFWEDIDCDRKTLTVKRQLQYRQDVERTEEDKKASNGTSNKGKGYWYYKPPKYESVRTITINDELVNLFNEYRAQCFKNMANTSIKHINNYVDEYPDGEFVESRILENKEGILVKPVFVQENGKYCSSNICQNICSIIHKNVTKDFDMHSLRKTHSTVLQNQGFDIRYIADRLGHVDLKTTKEVYYELSKDFIKTQDDKLDEFFQKVSKKGLLEGHTYTTVKELLEEMEAEVDESVTDDDNKW